MNQAAPDRGSRPVDARRHEYLGEERGNREAAAVRAIASARRARDRLIGRELFADPAWDMLLALYAASLAQRRLSTSELVLAAAVPATTGLRWMDKLESLGLLIRRGDPLDARRVWVGLSREGESRMRALFDALRHGRLPI